MGEGRIEIHGYVEEQVRALAADYDHTDGWDLSQWYNVLSVETDLHLFPDGIGPFDLVSGFVRLEARFDCIWYHGCGMFHGVNAWGNNAKKFPDRNSNARKSGYTGSLFTGDTRPIHSIRIDQLGFEDKDEPVGGRNTPAYLWHVPGVDTLFGVPGRDGVVGTDDDPAFLTFGRFVRPGHEYRFGLRRTKGQPDGTGLQVLGPFFPENKIAPIGALRDVPNPFNPMDLGPSSGEPGSAFLPYRPAPFFPASNHAPGNREEAARGLFIPNEAVAELIRKKEFDDFDQNFSQGELAWNKGASQQDERELKEAYLDLEMLDSRLWLRIGKQNIVWGKTELFRTTDQFNPQDLALATLASLEETRIALWAVRGVYSFYSVGPLEDVRLELAFNFDDMEPADLGRCGEPYTPNPVCDKTAGLFAHGLVGTALAGEIRPPDPWDDIEGLEFGARMEFRWNRFSFALSDFYGYDDFPYVDPIFYYTRNVDPRTGRPRRAQTKQGCDPEGLFDGDTEGCLSAEDALEHHHANQQRFAVICSSSVGFSSLDRSACAQSVFNSNRSALTGEPDAVPSITTVLGQVFSGSTAGATIVRNFFVPGLIGLAPKQAMPIVNLNRDPGDGAGAPNSISAVLSDEQESLLGCGAFWGTDCDNSTSQRFGGLDLLNAELSALMQSWPGFPGTSGSWNTATGPSGRIQPGTIRNCAAFPGSPDCGDSNAWRPFTGGAVATRFEDGRAFTLPGARSPFPEATELRQGPVAWDPNVDGCVSGVLGHAGCAGPKNELIRPWYDGTQWQFLQGDYFQSEMAAFSWNYLATLIAFSRNDPPGGIKPEVPCAPGQDPSTCREINELIADPVLALRLDGCSFARPELCSNVQAIYSIAHTTRKSVRAGGTGDFGRVDSDWHQGGVGVLRYEKRNVLGFAMDFAEDVTKSNWGIESTWIQGNPFEDRDEFDQLRRSDTFNLTVSVDRPTFISFLNRGRTFFFNSQWFFQWIGGYRESYVAAGPWNVLATFHVDTGYFRDRLLPGITFVYDFQSNSGAILPEIAYRFTENLSVTLSMALFAGRYQPVKPALRSIGDFPYRAGRRQSVDWSEQGLSPVRDNDEVALRLRWTF
ncbi:MAG: hypothetical protein DCC71_22180 [Proteobacteria bacterium]|nr:MAG: hypothetical protein DCC71_22180 [Pseudomonadota bacterium]